MDKIPEGDWKKLRSMNDEALNLFCERIFNRVEKISEGRRDREHEAYLELWKLIQDKDEEVAFLFNDLRRSNAVVKLARWKAAGIIFDEQFEEFSEAIQNQVLGLIKFWG